MVDAFHRECESEVFKAKENYLEKLGNKLVDTTTNHKSLKLK